MNRPATAEEKLWLRLEQAREFGKEFNEELERRVLGLDPVEGRPPINVEADTSRQKLARQEDKVAENELAATAAQAEKEDLAKVVAQLEGQNRKLQEQINELLGKVEKGPVALAPKPTMAPPLHSIVGEPNEEWTRPQLLQYARENGLPINAKLQMQSRTSILNWIKEEMSKRETVEV